MPTRKPRQKNSKLKRELICPFQLPENCCDRNILRRAVIAALTEDLSFHKQLIGAMKSAGFRVTRITKHSFHHCWEIRLERSPSMFEDTYAQIRHRIRRALKAEKLYSKFEGFELGFQGRQLVVGFICKFGRSGLLNSPDPL